MVGSQHHIDEWNRRVRKEDYWIALQVHDELVFDFPAGRGAEPWKTNLAKIAVLKRAMESCGDRIGIPTPVEVEYNAVDWSKGRKIKRKDFEACGITV